MKMKSFTDANAIRYLIDEMRKTTPYTLDEIVDSIDRFSLRVPHQLGECIRDAATHNRISVNQYIMQAILEKLSIETYLVQLEEEIDSFSLLTECRTAMPRKEALLDMDKFNESRQRYKDKMNGSKIPKLKLMRSIS